MRRIKRDLIKKYYFEAPDQFAEIKSKIDLNPSNSKLIRLRRENIVLRYSNVFSILLILVIGVLLVVNLNKPNSEVKEISFHEYFDITLRSKVREENIKEIYGVLIPLTDDEKALFIHTFNDFELNKVFVDPVLDDFDYLYYRIVFNDNSEVIVKVFENHIVNVNVEDKDFYFIEPNAYEILK